MAYPKQTKSLDLDLRRIPITSQRTAKEAVGDFVRDEILRFVSQGRSPVSGRGAFPRLDSSYADKEKNGRRVANLELNGDMLDALTYEITDTGIEIGIFEDSQEGKADGHNNFSGDSKLPTRRFIPSQSEEFTASIMRGTREILDRYREDPFSDRVSTSALALASTVLSGEEIEIDDILASLLGSQL